MSYHLRPVSMAITQKVGGWGRKCEETGNSHIGGGNTKWGSH